jgi:hypothetical protein
MWPFDRREQRKCIVQAFSKYLSPEMIDSLVRDPSRLARTGRDLRTAEIDFLVLQVCDDVLEDVPKHLEAAFDIVMDFDGTIVSTMSSVMDVAFGIPIRGDMRSHADECAGAAARLVAELGSNVRVVFGRANGLYGIMGGEQRVVYGTVVPNFTPVPKTLIATEFGRSVRI